MRNRHKMQLMKYIFAPVNFADLHNVQTNVCLFKFLKFKDKKKRYFKYLRMKKGVADAENVRNQNCSIP